MVSKVVVKGPYIRHAVENWTELKLLQLRKVDKIIQFGD